MWKRLARAFWTWRIRRMVRRVERVLGVTIDVQHIVFEDGDPNGQTSIEVIAAPDSRV